MPENPDDTIATVQRAVARKREHWEALVRQLMLRRSQGATAEEVIGIELDADQAERDYRAASYELIRLKQGQDI